VSFDAPAAGVLAIDVGAGTTDVPFKPIEPRRCGATRSRVRSAMLPANSAGSRAM